MLEQRRSLYTLFLVSLSFFLSNLIISPTLPLYISSLGASMLELGLLMAISSVVVIIGRIPFGMVSERIGRWPVIVFALLVQSTSLILYFFASNVL